MDKMQSKWVDILTPQQLNAQYDLTASIDPRFAKVDREWWESRTEQQLRCEKAYAWNCASGDSYQRAASYLSMMGAA